MNAPVTVVQATLMMICWLMWSRRRHPNCTRCRPRSEHPSDRRPCRCWSRTHPRRRSRSCKRRRMPGAAAALAAASGATVNAAAAQEIRSAAAEGAVPVQGRLRAGGRAAARESLQERLHLGRRQLEAGSGRRRAHRRGRRARSGRDSSRCTDGIRGNLTNGLAVGWFC